MELIDQSFCIESEVDGQAILKLLESAGRTCYKSEGKICEGSAAPFIGRILGRHHESVIEHASITVRFITNRGVTHELVRHRLVAYSQESTRYCNYTGGMQFIRPAWEMDQSQRSTFEASLHAAEAAYNSLITAGQSPQQAREVLPNALKTEIVMTANLRVWRHVLRERTARAAHPQIRALMIPLLSELKRLVPVVFDDIEVD